MRLIDLFSIVGIGLLATGNFPKTYMYIKKAALTKVHAGLPNLAEFTEKLVAKKR